MSFRKKKEIIFLGKQSYRSLGCYDYEYLLNLSKIIFKKCNCRAIARLDFILDSKSNCFYFLELNTHPGLTSISLVPEQAQYNGINYLSLIEKIISSS